MITLNDLTKISETEWEIPQSFRDDMRGPVRIFATRELLNHVLSDKSLEQAVNATTLPGLVGAVTVMPDMHQGYGFPIGGVAATEFPQGVISPGAIGYDINCGVRLLASQIEAEDAIPRLDMLATRLNQYCPSGVGVDGMVKVSIPELERLLRDGAKWALKNGYATKADLVRTEENGTFKGADPRKVSERAKKRGRSQIGSLGAGNHFIEVDVVEEIFDEQAAAVMGLREGYLAVQIHTGSRGLGHQICTDYVREFQSAVHRYNIQLPDRELVCAPMDSPEGAAYLGAMRCAANFAFVNRQLLAHASRRAFEETFAGKSKNWHLHTTSPIIWARSKSTRLRENASRSVFIAKVRRALLVLAPLTCRPNIKPSVSPFSFPAAWGRPPGFWSARLRAKQGIHIRAGSMRGLAEEAPNAYKDVDAIVETVAQAGIARKVARLRPLAVIKG